MPSETVYVPRDQHDELMADVEAMDMFDNFSQAIRYYAEVGRRYEKDQQE